MSSIEQEEQHWIRYHMPVLVEFATTPTDQWLRDAIRGSEGVEVPPLQRVIVQGTREAERIVTALANLKYKRHLPYGGAMHRRASDAEVSSNRDVRTVR